MSLMLQSVAKPFLHLCQRCQQIHGLYNSRLLSARVTKAKDEKFRIEAEAPSSNDKIWIGPPDPVSNIRPVKFPNHPDESSIEYKFYKQQAETIQWNQDFWSKHNTKFFKEKEDFVNKIKAAKNNDREESVNAEELSQFYKAFLDENRKVHLQYNRDWYKKNISLLWPAIQATVVHAFRRLCGNGKKS